MKRKPDFTATLESSQTGSAPLVHVYLPDLDAPKGALVVLPGGGYAGRAPYEGEGYALRFCDEGLACFVVDYRLGPDGVRHPAMLEDALAAIGTVRRRAEEWRVPPDRIGVIGSSAGGHLAAHASIAWNTYPEGEQVRPDFTVLCYPVISSDPGLTHIGSMQNLLGEEPTAEQLAEVALERRVHDQVPPCFLWHTYEDGAVPAENSLLFAAALRKCSLPHELHLYQKGGHGLGLTTTFDWAGEVMRWLGEWLFAEIPD